jgi:hypothetical protein
MSASCRLCGGNTQSVARQRLLGKYDVDYQLCTQCELLQTEPPYWLDEAYSQAISQLDTGAVQRNQRDSRLAALLARVLEIKGACLDYGGGHGVFVRMMRDLGFDFRWFDKYADNLYARGFEATLDQQYALVTAFEVLEHFADVRSDLEQLFAMHPDHVLVGTVLHAGHQPDWWYYMLESGQHVAFYTPRTLEHIAQRFGYVVIAAPEYSLFVRNDLAPGALRRAVVRRLLEHPSVAGFVPRQVVQRRSLIQDDHAAMRERLR